GPPARRLVARPPVLRGMAQASWPVALFPPLRGLAPWAAGPRRGVVRGLDALAFTPAGHTARSPAEQRHVIRSLLDTDRYKFTMMQAVLHRYPAAQASYRFRCRSKGVDLARHIDAISDAIDALCALRLAPDELDYLRGLRFIAPDFVDVLGLFHLDCRYVRLERSSDEPGGLSLTLEGPWLHTILFEVPLLAIVSEAWSVGEHGPADAVEGMRRLREKAGRIAGAPGFDDCRITDFGTRRRYSRDWHEAIVPELASLLGRRFAGPSNVDIARRHGL